jgi:molybdate transport system ATP-binding protein
VEELHIDVSVPLRTFDLRVTLGIARETVAVVGPSGAGKTTLLRSIAGLVQPTEGSITLGAHKWFDAATGISRSPEDRSTGFVFQDYALFPHMTVRDNVAFGTRDGVDDLLRTFRIDDLAAAHPRDLSGGERQRVALARAVARRPAVLLLDEPMAALDPDLRSGVRAELRELLGELSLPTLLVTHDFEDAAALADRVGVLVDGRIRQLGTPSELVASPLDPFVARLTGANLLPGSAAPSETGLTRVVLDSGEVLYSTDELEGRAGVVVYPWDVSIGLELPDDSTLNHVRAEIRSVVRLGNRARVQVGSVTGEITTASVDRLALEPGKVAVASFKATGTRLVPLERSSQTSSERT